MRTKSPSENVPSLDNLYDVLKDFIREHQGDKGFINTDPKLEDGTFADTIYGIRFNNDSRIGEEVIVFGVRVKNNDIEVITKPYMRTYHNAPSPEEYANDSLWRSLQSDDEIYYIPTIYAIAETIEEYVES